MSLYKLNFGGVDFPSGMRPAGGDTQQDLGLVERPRAAGATWQTGRVKSRILQVKGDLVASTPDALQTAYDSLKAACYAGPAPLYYGRDDRYITAQLDTWTDDYSDGLLYGLSPSIAVAFVSGDPFFYATAATTPTLTTTGGTITPGGDTEALPTWTITVNGGGTGPLTLTNTTTGEVCTLSATFAAGAVIVLNRGAYTVTLGGVANFGLLGGRIPRLAVGANVITLAAGGTATITSLACSYTARYL